MEITETLTTEPHPDFNPDPGFIEAGRPIFTPEALAAAQEDGPGKMRLTRPRGDLAVFDWGDDRTRAEKVADGDVVVSGFDLAWVTLTGVIAPVSCLAAVFMTSWGWILGFGLGSAAATSFLTAQRHAEKTRLRRQLAELGRLAGSLRFHPRHRED